MLVSLIHFLTRLSHLLPSISVSCPLYLSLYLSLSLSLSQTLEEGVKRRETFHYFQSREITRDLDTSLSLIQKTSRVPKEKKKPYFQRWRTITTNLLLLLAMILLCLLLLHLPPTRTGSLSLSPITTTSILPQTLISLPLHQIIIILTLLISLSFKLSPLLQVLFLSPSQLISVFVFWKFCMN